MPLPVPQQLEDEEVCCAQPALPSALPPQQLAIESNEDGHVQPISNTADRTSSSGTAGNKADNPGHAILASKPAQHGNMPRAPGAGPPASGGTVPAQNHGQGQPRRIDTSAVPDKENAGKMFLLLVLLPNGNDVHAVPIAAHITIASVSQA